MVFIGHGSAGRQAEALLEEALADRAAMHLGACEDGLEMHGLPDGTRFNVLRFERQSHLLAGNAGDGRINGEAS